MRSEDEILEQLARRLGEPRSQLVELGVGDDAAILRLAGTLLVSSDTLLLGIDLPANVPIRFLGEKAVAANVSDLLAMGGRPLALLSNLGWPEDADDEQVDEFLTAIEASARHWGLAIVGGDLSRAPTWFVSLTILGEPLARPWRRDGARPGDDLWYLGTPAGSAAVGLQLILAGARVEPDGQASWPREWELDPTSRQLGQIAIGAQLSPRLPVGIDDLAAADVVTAAIDLSDGLGLDARRLAGASAVRLEIDTDLVPQVSLTPQLESILGSWGTPRALAGGEDFALFLAADPAAGSVLEAAGARRIGSVTSGKGVSFRSRQVELDLGGFDHFPRRARG